MWDSKTFLAVAPVSGPIMLERYAVEKQEDQNSTLVALHVGKLLGALAQNGSADRIPMQIAITMGISLYFWHLLASSGTCNYLHSFKRVITQHHNSIS